MIIENGASLTIYGNYNAYANIIVKNGNIVNGENGKITFAGGHKLVLQGNSTIRGLSQDKLVLDFVTPTNGNGVLADSGLVIQISNCEIKNAETGITVSSFSYQSLESEDYRFRVDSTDFTGCEDHGINITGQYVNKAMIENCNFTGSTYGVSAVNLNEAVIRYSYFTNTDMGIRLINIDKADVLGNTIISNQYDMAGIFFDNSGGSIRSTWIEGHTNAIHIGNASPDIGVNTITGNKYHGIYVGVGSLPNMRAGRWLGTPPVFYAASGYNKVYENGGWSETGGPADNDGSEIFINNANVLLDEACNEIMDDREPSSPLIYTILLMNGVSSGFPISVKAEYNMWEEDAYYPLNSLRFGDLIVDYDPYYTESCPIPQGGGSGEGLLLSKSSGGEVIDTLYAVQREPGTLTENEILYSKANELFITGDYESAEIYYDQIISSNDTTENKLEAYTRKYSIGKLIERSPEYFNDLKNTYSTLSQSTENELLEKIFQQLSTKSLVGKQEYIPAISEYDEIIQQNPNSEEAVYAEIDALTTALLVGGNDSTLGKTSGGRYLVKTTEDYSSKLNDILRKHFSSKNETEEEEILPTEYTLYQNYPNPFNPATTINYDLPKSGYVKLKIYDILGREVRTLVNTQQEAGRYKVNFSAIGGASSLASGVYLCRLESGDFISVKKMILLK
jgi:tetratricopeptide (TPR) repeat protein